MTMRSDVQTIGTGSLSGPDATAGTAAQSHIYGMDLMRFAAAMMVVFYHMGTYGADVPVFDPPIDERAFPVLSQLTWAGWVGVQVFFVISGYVISASLRQGSVSRFAGKRAVRILPTLWICTTLALFIRLAWGEPLDARLADWLRAFFLSPKGPYIDGVVWTLVVEGVFYILIGTAIWLTGKMGIARRVTLDVGALLLTLFSAAFLGLYVLSAIKAPALQAQLSWFGFKLVLLHHGVFFAAGMALSAMHRLGETPLRLATFRIAIIFGMGEIYAKSGMGQGSLVPLTIFLAMVLALQVSVVANRRIAALPMARTSPLLGLMSYPIYLCHFTLGMYLVPLLERYTDQSLVVIGVTLAATLGLAYVITRGPEPWLQGRLRRVLLPRR
ncbi:acyltransferase family protein [Pseudooceanicola nanhaiensis]|uniref:acyltransferase family protein n=1 Tax=Pseudooceanicola nanhaiensis TaxID=375761 RepID=UPI001CD36713|nr:acyltransferase [Pseudooceanicola nanhaiensis]MCA0921695.1 acyltransferase [Pseudooceanicola nanhaiensis]